MKSTLASLLICAIVNITVPMAATTSATADPQGWREWLCTVLPCR